MSQPEPNSPLNVVAAKRASYAKLGESYTKAAAIMADYEAKLRAALAVIDESLALELAPEVDLIGDLQQLTRQVLSEVFGTSLTAAEAPTGTSVSAGSTSEAPKKTRRKRRVVPKEGPPQYNPQVFAESMLRDVFVEDKGLELLDNLSGPKRGSIRGTMRRLLAYRTNQPIVGYEEGGPSLAMVNLATALELTTDGSDAGQWKKLVRRLYRHDVLSIEEAQELVPGFMASESPEAAAS